MKLEGPGIWIWVIDQCENGNVEKIVQKAKEHNVQYIMPKATNGTVKYARNWTVVGGEPRIVALTKAAQAAGIKVVPWGWVFGRSTYSPYNSISLYEANLAAEVIEELGADGWIVDAEHDWKRTHLEMWREADRYMDALESKLVQANISVPVFVSTYRYPELHRAFPYNAWSQRLRPERNDGWMPQVYWEMDHRLGAGANQLVETIRQYEPFMGELEFAPAGSAYGRGDWHASEEQVRGFLQEATNRNLSPNLWSWQHMDVADWRAVKEVWGGIDFGDEPSDPEEPSDPVDYVKEVEITAYALNQRKGPHYQNPLAGRPLGRGQVVRIYEVINEWGRISKDSCNWISLYWTKDV